LRAPAQAAAPRRIVRVVRRGLLAALVGAIVLTREGKKEINSAKPEGSAEKESTI
jgi:hypothetical protein